MKTSTLRIQPEAQADLLCYLVATAAVTYSLTDEWRVDHIVISCRTWLKRNGTALPWLDRIQLGQLALQVARRDLRGAGIAVTRTDAFVLFTDDMTLNLASTIAQRMLQVCRDTVAVHRHA